LRLVRCKAGTLKQPGAFIFSGKSKNPRTPSGNGRADIAGEGENGLCLENRW